MYMYNVLVNWLGEKELKQGRIHFYEWRENDPIEKLIQTKVVYMSRGLFDAIYYYDIGLPNAIKKRIRNETYLIRLGEKVIYPYVCIITDKERACAIQWNDDKPLYISDLLPHQERYIVEQMKTLQKMKKHYLFFPVFKKRMNCTHTRGLTRLEKEKRALLLTICRQIAEHACDKELMYWLKEWYYEINEPIEAERDIHMLWRKLYQRLKTGWTLHHDVFFRKVSTYHYGKQMGRPLLATKIQEEIERKKCYNEHHSTE